MIVFLNSDLSDITNRTKNKREMTKQIMLIIPKPDSLFLNERIASSRGTNRNSMKPIAEPAPCILEAVVTTSFDSFTLKNPVNIQAPIAKTAINTTSTFVNPPETEL